MMSNSQVARVSTPKRMSLADVVRGRQEMPDRVLLYGVEGIGKSTWATGARAPIFIPAEDGTAALDIARFPDPKNWTDVLEAVRTLTDEQHDFQTVVLDTLDAVEPMLWQHICQRDKKASIEDYGYGKGYVAALDEWRGFLASLERLRRARGMSVVLLAHSWIKPFKSPDTDDYDRYELKLHVKAGGLVKEWCDSVLFAHYETFATKNERTGAAKGISTGARVVHTQRTAAWDAKNRYSLPEVLPLSYEDYANAVRLRQSAPPEKLRASIAAKLAELADETVAKKVEPLVKQAGDDAIELSKIDNKLTATLTARKGA